MWAVCVCAFGKVIAHRLNERLSSSYRWWRSSSPSSSHAGTIKVIKTPPERWRVFFYFFAVHSISIRVVLTKLEKWALMLIWRTVASNWECNVAGHIQFNFLMVSSMPNYGSKLTTVTHSRVGRKHVEKCCRLCGTQCVPFVASARWQLKIQPRRTHEKRNSGGNEIVVIRKQACEHRLHTNVTWPSCMRSLINYITYLFHRNNILLTFIGCGVSGVRCLCLSFPHDFHYF